MKVTVLGKQNLQGTSRRTGKSFDSNVVHVSMEQNGVEGKAVQTIWLDPNTYPLAGIRVGAAYTVDYDSRGFLLAFTPC